MHKGVLLALLVTCGTAHAADWRKIEKSKAGEELLDVSSIHVTGSIRRGWFKSIFPPDSIRVETGPYANKWWLYSIELDSFDCDAGTTHPESLIVYYADGTHTFPQPYPPTTAWAPVPPDTIQDLELRFICGWKQK